MLCEQDLKLEQFVVLTDWQDSWLNTFMKIWWKRYSAFSPAQHLPCRKTSKHKNNSKPQLGSRQLQCQSDLSWGDLRNPSVFNLDFNTDLELVLLHRPSSLKANSTFLCCESMCLSFLKIESVMADLCVSVLFVWVRKCVFICSLPLSVSPAQCGACVTLLWKHFNFRWVSQTFPAFLFMCCSST